MSTIKKLTDEVRKATFESLVKTATQAKKDAQTLAIDAIAQYLVDAGEGINAFQSLVHAMRNSGLDAGRFEQWAQATVNVAIAKDGKVSKGGKKKDKPALLIAEAAIIPWYQFAPVGKDKESKLIGVEELLTELNKWAKDEKGETREVDDIAQEVAKRLTAVADDFRGDVIRARSKAQDAVNGATPPETANNAPTPDHEIFDGVEAVS